MLGEIEKLSDVQDADNIFQIASKKMLYIVKIAKAIRAKDKFKKYVWIAVNRFCQLLNPIPDLGKGPDISSHKNCLIQTALDKKICFSHSGR